MRATMQDHYPSVDYYTCSNGVLRPLSTMTMESWLANKASGGK
jgi:hypothetical protein